MELNKKEILHLKIVISYSLMKNKIQVKKIHYIILKIIKIMNLISYLIDSYLILN